MQSIFSNPYPGREDFAQWRPLMVPNGLAGRHAKTLPCRRWLTSAVVIVGAMMAVTCIAALVFELVERTVVL